MDVLICDVGPRDGLQNEPEALPPATRAELVTRLAAAGVPRIEAVSFVRDDRVPQMADAEEVVAGAPRGNAELSGLVLNERGHRAVRGDDARPRQLHARSDGDVQRAERQCHARRGGRRVQSIVDAAEQARHDHDLLRVRAVRSRVRSIPARSRRSASGSTAPTSSCSRTRSASRRHGACDGSSSACRSSARASARTCTTRATRATPRPGRRSTAARRCSTRRSAGSAAVRSRRTRPATSPPRISSGSSSATASAPGSTSPRSSTSRCGSRSCSAGRLEGYVYRAARWP